MTDKDKRPTIRDVAREAGVSTTSVSFVANGTNLKYVSEANRERIREVISALDYSSNPDAVALVKSKKPVTLRDVARDAGVSIATASHALSGRGRVSLETRLEVEAAAEMLNYQPSIHARRLRQKIMKGGN